MRSKIVRVFVLSSSITHVFVLQKQSSLCVLVCEERGTSNGEV